MKYLLINAQKGVGLIEVFITTVVVAVGLLAVASLQGQFMSGSGVNKTRSEALVLAEKKIEELRNNVTTTGYNALAAGSTSDSITGTNASFTRTWTITGGDAPNQKKMSVQVGWDANGDGTITSPGEVVNVVTQMAWIDPSKTALYAASNAGGASSVASPRQNASEDAAAENVIGTNLAITDLDLATVGSAGVDTTVQVTPPGGSAIIIYQVATGSHFYTATTTQLSSIAAGVIAVFLCSDADNNTSTPDTCTHIQNHFGGVPHRIAGTVYSTSPLGFTNIKVAWTSSSVSDCYNGTVTTVSGSGNSQYRYKPYECIYAGNCDATADNVNGCTYGVTDAQILARKVGPGGEYGDVGLLGVNDQGGDREQVCLLEDTADPATSLILSVSGSNVLNETYLSSVTKRFYAARRIKRNGSSNDQKSEGVNRSYTNHNFLVVPRGSGASANTTCNIKASVPYSTSAAIQLAPREIFKVLDESSSNTSLADYAYAGATGTAKTFTGTSTSADVTVTGSATKLKLIIPDVGNCYLDNNMDSTVAATKYACVVPNGTTSIDIKGGSNEHPSINPAVFATCTKTDATTCKWLANFSATASASVNCTAPWDSSITVNNSSSVTAYLASSEPYGNTPNAAVSGSTCQNAETRTCNSGTLSGSYTYQTCSIAAGANCTAPWGTAVANNASVAAYSTATVPAGTSCSTVASTRTCTDGILSNSGNYGSCAVQTTRTIVASTSTSGTGTVSGITVTGSGATCTGMSCEVDNAWTGTLTATGTCSGGGSVNGTSANITASETTASIALSSCTGPVCATPWDVSSSIASGASLTAYQYASVLSPSSCTSGTRYCTDGVLSVPSYIYQSCTVIPTYSITVNAANGSGTVTAGTCNEGACTGLVAGGYTVAATLSGGNTCSTSVTLSSASKTVTVTKATGQGTVCSMVAQ